MSGIVLVDHKVEDNGVFRLNYEKFLGAEVRGKNTVKWALNNHTYPKEITRDEAHTLLSFIIDRVLEKDKGKESTVSSLIRVDKMLPSLGFPKEPFDSFTKPVDLFVIEGDKKCFTHTKDYQRYFNWKKENVSEEEAFSIYQKMNVYNKEEVKRFIKRI